MERSDSKPTLRVLSGFRYLKIQVQEIEQRIDELEREEKAESGTLRYRKALARLKDRLWVSRARCLEEEAHLRELIDHEENPLMRSILLQLIRGKNWTQIALALGGNNTKAGVKAQFYRWRDEQKVATKCNS